MKIMVASVFGRAKGKGERRLVLYPPLRPGGPCDVPFCRYGDVDRPKGWVGGWMDGWMDTGRGLITRFTGHYTLTSARSRDGYQFRGRHATASERAAG